METQPMVIKRHATSPAGDRIEILSDADWLSISGKDERTLRAWNGGTKKYAIAELWHGGASVDPTGHAARQLWKRMTERFGADVITSNPNSFSMLVKDPNNAPAFETDTRVKRTHAIKLIALPQSWYDKLEADNRERAKQERAEQRARDKAERERLEAEAIAEVETVQVVTPTGDVVNESMNGTEHVDRESDRESDEAFDAMIRDMELDAPTVYETAPPLDIQIASQVAMSLLTTVVEIISAGSAASVDEKVRKLQGDLTDVMGKLSARLEENDRMRRQLRQAGDEITALRHERDGLRSRLRATEANLTAALKGDAVQAINGEIQKRVESIMRVAPTKKGDD